MAGCTPSTSGGLPRSWTQSSPDLGQPTPRSCGRRASAASARRWRPGRYCFAVSFASPAGSCRPLTDVRRAAQVR
ncbi:hypothetical protein D7I43_30065 [Micromonospora globbae]|uniref:Uncharacterized protein n=1 Tax=Micromonospora globbae TaxID=1894969 RepID=A0A420ESN1_9ACTN|nr:hypothetical protein D7I43_30065 [Micromonospora globbae]